MVKNKNSPQNSQKRHNSSDKRKRDPQEEVSPTSVQDSKVLKMGESVQDLLKQISSDITEMKKDIKDIKQTQDKYIQKVDVIEARVDNLEKEFEVMREFTVDDGMIKCVRELQKRNNALEQIALNDRLTMRNLPIEVCNDKDLKNSIVANVFEAIGSSINANQYDTYAFKDKKKNTASVNVKLSTTMDKIQILRKFRETKKKPACALLVEKFVNLTPTHNLKGKLITISNQLTATNLHLLKTARKFEKSHFDFVLDTPEGRIMARVNGKFEKIEDEGDIMRLKDQIEEQKLQQSDQVIEVETQRQKNKKQHPIAPSNIATRSTTKNN